MQALCEWGFFSLQFRSIPGHTLYWFLRPDVLEAHLLMHYLGVGLSDVEFESLLKEITFL